MFYAGTLGYYSQMIALNHISGLQSGGHFNLSAGIGTIGYEPKVNYFFGFPRAIQPGGISFDIPFIQVSAVNDGNNEKLKQFNLQTGVLSSALEHSTPEQMFNDPDNPPEAISTIKALLKASAAGQRINQITQDNLSQVMTNLNLDGDIKAEIRASVNAGKMVITHTDNVSVPGCTGAGYAILDSETNVGAWKISGGGNGGFLLVLGALALVIGMFLLSTILTGGLLVPFLIGPLLIGGLVSFVSGVSLLHFSGVEIDADILNVVRLITALLLLVFFPIIAGATGILASLTVAKFLFVLVLGVLLSIPSDSNSE